MNNKSYILQNIILPDLKICDEIHMYLRSDNNVQIFSNNLKFSKNAECEFSTYFNAFSLNKYKEYTNVKKLFIYLNISGHFMVNVYAASLYKNKIVKECLVSEEIDNTDSNDVYIDIPETNKDNIYFTLISLSDGGKFFGGYFGTNIEDNSLHPVEIDLVMCTFKREKFIKRNINLLKENFFDNSKYNAAGHLKIKVVDNGQTLTREEVETEDKSIKLYPNINTGGSGGFTRGMIESLKENKATHILFMDDDVLIQVEALERTYNLLRLLKDDYSDAFLAGAMLRLDKKNIQHENIAKYNFTFLESFKTKLDLNRYKNVIFNEKPEYFSNGYAGWWYCCMPIANLSIHNLPYPFFIRGDDIEFSIRNKSNIINMNSISVWHEPFELKYSTLLENYFMFRNFMVINTIHSEMNFFSIARFLARRFFREIFRYDYSAAELLLDGVECYMQGSKFFQNIDTVNDLKVHAVKQIKVKPISSIKDTDRIYNEFKNDLMNVHESKIKKILRVVSLNGHFMPNCAFKDKGYAEYGYSSNSKHYFCRRKVLGCSLNFDEGVILEIKREKCLRLMLRYIKTNLKLFIKYNQLRKEYRETFPYMTSLEFWEKYLHLN